MVVVDRSAPGLLFDTLQRDLLLHRRVTEGACKLPRRAIFPLASSRRRCRHIALERDLLDADASRLQAYVAQLLIIAIDVGRRLGE
jgi:hypothetical protein